MNKNENKQNKDIIKQNSLSKMKATLERITSNNQNKNITRNKSTLKKKFFSENINNKLNFGNLNTYIKTLKKNNSQIFNEKNTLPKLNNNSNNTKSINISTNKIKSFSPLLNNHSSINKPLLKNIVFPKSVKNIHNQPIKIQFFSKMQKMTINHSTDNSNILKSLISPKTRFFSKKNFLKNRTISNSLIEEVNKNENNSNNSNNSEEKIILKKRVKKFKPFGFSEFYKLSKNSNISARNIYEHYIMEEMEDEFQNEKMRLTKYILKKNINRQKILDNLYGINENNERRLREIKNNDSIALKPDFNIKEYQNILCGMIKNRCDNDSIFYLKQKYEKFNDDIKSYKKNFNYKGRYTKLGDKIRKNIPSYLYYRLKELDKENLMAKAKYFNVDIKKYQEDERKK